MQDDPTLAAVKTLRAKLSLLENTVEAAKQASLLDKAEKLQAVGERALEMAQQTVYVLELLEAQLAKQGRGRA